ncbi:telomere-associated protein RIF1 [Gastrophryne carolinensis]
MANISQDTQLLPLLETLEDASTSPTEQTDAYLSIVNRLSGEDGKEFTVLVGRQFTRLYNAFKTHISHQNSDLSNAALQTLGFCVFYNRIASNISASEVQELLASLNSIAVKTTDKNTCTRALWVISKQNFSGEEVGKVVPSILSTLENVLNKDLQSLIIAYEALNVVIRLLEQTPVQMTEEAVRWAKLIVPLVVHSAPKVRIRAATALEIGIPLLLQKQPEVSALTEQLMSSKIIGELHKLFTSKNETYVLKLWPLFVKLLGKTLHRSGNFINSLLQLEELGFRNGSPAVKKIAFIAWKSLIDNFSLNPDILCSSKRLKLLMQPLASIHVRTEALALTKVEVWWYLLIRLGSQLPMHFEQVCLPLIQSALTVDTTPQTSQLRSANQSAAPSTPLQKGPVPFGSPATPKINLNSSLLASVAFPSVHLLGIEMMLHFLLGPEVVQFASKHKLVLSLEPLQHPLISSSSFFSKHATTLLGAVQDGFITIGKDASGIVLHAVWKDMIEFVKASMETGNKKEKQGSEVLTTLLLSLKNIISSDALQVEKCMGLLECTVKGLPQKVLGSAAYQVPNMDLLNGTPALFLIQLHFHAGILEHGVTEERFFINFETLVNYVLSGPTSPLAFSESVLNELTKGAQALENKELLWRMWSILINPLTEKVNQTNEVNQGDALEHNFSAMNSALMLPITHIFPISAFPLPTMKTLMRTWSELYKAFARCAALVTTTDENVCCEELCSRMLLGLDDQPMAFYLLERIVQVVTVIVDCINFSPYSTKFQPKTKAPLTPTDWAKRKRGPLGNLSSLFKLLVKLTEEFHHLCSDQTLVEANTPALSSVGSSILSTLSTSISHISLPSILRTVSSLVTKPVAVFYMKTKSDSPKVYSALGNKLDKLLGDILSCLGSRYTGAYDNDLLEALSPLLCAIFLHKNKQFRTQAAQFWNGSFAKAATLVYPDELKPVLSQVKTKTPLLLPGFTFTSTAEESSGPYSDNLENSQLGTKISGIEVKSTGKRDSLLARTELKEKGTPTKSLQAKKLDFSSPNPKKKILEEEQSVDFVFIPPETKERVLTEHQKEVLRTKRVDIPTMYNNLDASQDTTMFSQYTLSQDNSQDKPATVENAEEKIPDTKENAVVKETEGMIKDKPVENDVADVEMLEDEIEASKSLNDSVLNTSKEVPNSSNISNNSSTSSDLVLGTPPPPVSRRQSFITLEKFENSGNRSFSPLSDTKFPKAVEVILVSDSQDKDKKQKPNEKREKRKSSSQSTSQRELSKSVSRRVSRTLRLAEDTEKTEDPNSKSVTVAGEAVDDEFVPDSQPPQAEEKITHQEEKENCTPESSTDCKENTPPEAVNQIAKAEPQKVPVNQIALRRSSRRQSEILECVKKEASTDKLSQNKEEQKTGLNKTQQPKEVLSKQASEKLFKMEGRADSNLVINSEENLQVNTSVNPDLKQEELPDTNLNEEMPRGRSRYQTRRSLQAVQTGSENSESDYSEPREGTGKRKRGRPRRSDKSEPLEKTESESQVEDATLPAGHTEKDVDSVTEGFSEIDSQSDIDGETYVIMTGNSRSKIPRLETNGHTVLSSTIDVNKTYDVTNIRTAQSLLTEPTTGDFSTAVSDVFRNTETSSNITDCHHKRSRRLRKSKSCDCCRLSNKEERNFTELKSEEIESKNKTINASSFMQFNDTFSRPCAISTPLVTRQQTVFKGSAGEIKSDTESEQEQTVVLNESKNDPEEVTQICIKTKTLEALECSNEPTVCAEVTNIQKETNVENTNFSEKCFGKTYCIMEQKEKTEEQSRFKTFDIDTGDASINDMDCEKTENPKNIMCKLAEKEDVITKENGAPFSAPVQASADEVTVEMTEGKTNRSSAAETNVAVIKPCFVDSKMEEGKACADETVFEAEAAPAVEPLPEAAPAVEPLPEAAPAVEPLPEAAPAVEPLPEAVPAVEPAEANATFTCEPSLNAARVSAEELLLEDVKRCVGEHSIEAVKESLEESPEAKKASAEPSKEASVSDGEIAKQAVVDGQNTVCEELDSELVKEAASEKKPVDIAGYLEQEHAQRFCEENTEAVTVQAADMLKMSALNEDSKATEAFLDSSEKCFASGAAETVHTDLGEGRSSTDSPPKLKGFTSMAVANDSPSGSFCWSPSASPSTSILKKGLKRQQTEIDSPSPVNKMRRVSFADPIYQEGLADDIDRRSPVVRNNSANNSPSSRSLKMLTMAQPKIITTPTKGFVSPGSRVLGFKSSKKSLISEMTKESMPSPKESVYPALMNCPTPVDVILPQITSNMWARGLGQLIRAKNIKTIGDLSTLTPCEIKTLPVRSPKISTVKKALRAYHEQQTRVKGFDEYAALDETEKPLNGLDEKPLAVEEKLEADLPEASSKSPLEAEPAPDLHAQINTLSLLLTTEELGKYSGSQLFEMQEKLGAMTSCLLRHLQSRWRSPPHDGSV